LRASIAVAVVALSSASPLACATSESAAGYEPIGSAGSGGSTDSDAQGGSGGSKPDGNSPEASPDVASVDADASPDSEASTPDAVDGAPIGLGCFPLPACDAPAPDPGPARDWKNITSSGVVLLGSANHRGRDQFYTPGDAQWILGKFAYGLTDKDLKGEEIDIYVLRDCGTKWEKLGTAVTTNEGEHPTTEGVDDNGGRIYFQIPSGKELGIGRHRVHLVVGGDLTTADAFIEVVPKGTPLFVTDVDGTLTPSDTEEYTSLLTGSVSDAVDSSAAIMQLLASRGYHPLYLTARPEWLTIRTREFLSVKGFPTGILHTSPSTTGATGTSAATYKTTDLGFLVKRGIAPLFAFGNADTDAEAYHSTAITPKHAIYYQFTDSVYGGRRIEAFSELLTEFTALPDLCP
jgi:hypothetical protein